MTSYWGMEVYLYIVGIACIQPANFFAESVSYISGLDTI